MPLEIRPMQKGREFCHSTCESATNSGRFKRPFCHILIKACGQRKIRSFISPKELVPALKPWSMLGMQPLKINRLGAKL
jgi:hypothetical protein